MIFGRGVVLFREDPYLQELKVIFVAPVVFTMVDAFACTHYLNLTRSDGAGVLFTVAMGKVTFEWNGDDFHVFMRVHIETFARRHRIVV